MKPSDHYRITRYSINWLINNEFITEDHPYLNESELICVGTIAEDEKKLNKLINNPLKLFKKYYRPFTWRYRLLNWHFYNDNNKIKPIFNSRRLKKIISPDSKRIYYERVRQYYRNGYTHNTSDKFQCKIKMKLLGRVLHHLQDMSTPPHVIPNFHLSKEPFEDNLNKLFKDELLDVFKTTKVVPKFKKIQKDMYLKSTNEIQKLSYNLYSKIAQDTLHLLRTGEWFLNATNENNTKIKCFMTDIWPENQSRKVLKLFTGFCKYGVIGEHFGYYHKFRIRNKIISITRSNYIEFYKLVIKKVIEDTIFALLIFNPYKKIKKKRNRY